MRKEVAIALALVALCSIIAVNNSNFYGQRNLTNVTRQFAMYGILAIGSGVVIVAGGIDLSVGSVVALTSVVLAKLCALEKHGGMQYPFAVGIPVALGAAMLLGLIQGLLITRLKLQPFIVTLAGMLLFRGLAQTITAGGTITIADEWFREIPDSGIPLGREFVFTTPLIAFAVAALFGAYMLHATVFGRHLYAIGGNREAARYSGVPVRLVECLAYVISATFAGAAGIFFVAYSGDASPILGQGYELLAIAATVLGGCSLRGGEGTIVGIVIGVGLLEILRNGTNMLESVVVAAMSRPDPTGVARIMQRILPRNFRLENAKEIITGVVILGAVLLDQATQEWRDYRRRHKAR